MFVSCHTCKKKLFCQWLQYVTGIYVCIYWTVVQLVETRNCFEYVKRHMLPRRSDMKAHVRYDRWQLKLNDCCVWRIFFTYIEQLLVTACLVVSKINIQHGKLVVYCIYRLHVLYNLHCMPHLLFSIFFFVYIDTRPSLCILWYKSNSVKQWWYGTYYGCLSGLKSCVGLMLLSVTSGLTTGQLFNSCPALPTKNTWMLSYSKDWFL